MIISPLPYMTRWLDFIDLTEKTVLDYAAGSGRHGRYAHQKGAQVTFIDRDISKLLDLQGRERASIIQQDLEDPEIWPFDDIQYDIILVANYLYRPYLDRIFGLLTSNGILIYQTFAFNNAQFGRPKNPNFLLQERELKDRAPNNCTVIDYECGYLYEPNPAHIQRLVVRKN